MFYKIQLRVCHGQTVYHKPFISFVQFEQNQRARIYSVDVGNTTDCLPIESLMISACLLDVKFRRPDQHAIPNLELSVERPAYIYIYVCKLIAFCYYIREIRSGKIRCSNIRKLRMLLRRFVIIRKLVRITS